jgi:hypothetical protein
MFKNVLPVILILSTPLISKAQYDNWHPITPNKCAAEILFPEKPEYTTENSSNINQFLYDAAIDMMLFSLNCTEPIWDTNSMGDAQKYGILVASAQELLGSTDIQIRRHKIGEHPAVDYTQPLGDTVKIYHRSVIADGRIYQLSVADMNGTQNEMALLFFDTFKPYR